MSSTRCDDIRQSITENTILLDVRNANEHDVNRFPDAINIPLGELVAVAHEQLPKYEPILVYCHVGGRAEAAVKILRELGFTDVSSIGGVEHYKHCDDLIQD